MRRAARRNHIRGIVTGCVEGWTVLAGTLAFAVVLCARLCATRTKPVHGHLGSFAALRPQAPQYKYAKYRHIEIKQVPVRVPGGTQLILFEIV